ncbi:MAG TPA: hypothetical protein ACFYEM_11300, partial [Candidatus Hypogeohydataceae bacterium YC40]
MFHYTEKFRKGVLSVFFALLIPFLLIFLTLPESGQALFLDWYTGEKAPKYLLTGTVCSYVDRFYVEQERIHSQHMLVEG